MFVVGEQVLGLVVNGFDLTSVTAPVSLALEKVCPIFGCCQRFCSIINEAVKFVSRIGTRIRRPWRGDLNHEVFS